MPILIDKSWFVRKETALCHKDNKDRVHRTTCNTYVLRGINKVGKVWYVITVTKG